MSAWFPYLQTLQHTILNYFQKLHGCKGTILSQFQNKVKANSAWVWKLLSEYIHFICWIKNIKNFWNPLHQAMHYIFWKYVTLCFITATVWSSFIIKSGGQGVRVSLSSLAPSSKVFQVQNCIWPVVYILYNIS